MTEVSYVHGYSAREANRLADQASTLSELLHGDTVYPPGSLVLECGCGTGAPGSPADTPCPSEAVR